jgi:hypothetical protein
VHNDRLIAVGSFSTAGEIRTNRIASWDGAAWTPMDNGMTVSRIAIYRNELVAVGTIDAPDGSSTGATARWTGSGWQVVGPGPASVSMLTEYAGELYAGGSFPGGLMSWGCWPVRMIGDVDGDMSVDADDLRLLEACSSGPGVHYDVSGLNPESSLVPDADGLLTADFDRDGDVDMDDFAVLQRCRANGFDTVDPACLRTQY